MLNIGSSNRHKNFPLSLDLSHILPKRISNIVVVFINTASRCIYFHTKRLWRHGRYRLLHILDLSGLVLNSFSYLSFVLVTVTQAGCPSFEISSNRMFSSEMLIKSFPGCWYKKSCQVVINYWCIADTAAHHMSKICLSNLTFLVIYYLGSECSWTLLWFGFNLAS